jgi:hypothetical protein
VANLAVEALQLVARSASIRVTIGLIRRKRWRNALFEVEEVEQRSASNVKSARDKIPSARKPNVRQWYACPAVEIAWGSFPLPHAQMRWITLTYVENVSSQFLSLRSMRLATIYVARLNRPA